MAEPLGYDSVWSVEHHFDDYSMGPDGTQALSYLAARTDSIQLGTGAVILPWNDPLPVAEKIILLDHVSRGRLIFGMGRGLAKMEYEGFGLDMNEARERFDEAAALEALETGYMEGDGQFYKQSHVELRPKPSRSFKGTGMMTFLQTPPEHHLPAIESSLLVKQSFGRSSTCGSSCSAGSSWTS